MVSAVESLSDRVLANLEKGHIRADVYEALRILKAAGIVFRPTWVATEMLVRRGEVPGRPRGADVLSEELQRAAPGVHGQAAPRLVESRGG